MRTLVDIPNDDIRRPAKLGEQLNRPRAALIRAAIAEYLARHPPLDAAGGFGLWDSNVGDGLKYQKKLRSEW